MLSTFGTRTNDLLRDTWQFTLSLNNIIPYSPVTWNRKGFDPIPFARPMLQLEEELQSLSKRIAEALDNPGVPALEGCMRRLIPPSK